MFARVHVAALFSLVLSVGAAAQTQPSVSGPLRQNQTEIKITGQAQDATHAKVELGLCVADDEPKTCTTYIDSPKMPVAMGATGTTTVTLATPLKVKQWVMTAQVIDGKAPVYSKPVQVTAADPVVIKTGPKPPLTAISGTAQIPSAATDSPVVYKEVAIYVCASQDRAKAGKTDCSGTQEPKDTSLVQKLSGDVDSVKMGASNTYLAPLKSEIKNSTYVWTVEKITPGAGPAFALLSPPLSLYPPQKPWIDKTQLHDGGRGVFGTATPSTSDSDQVMVHLCVAKADDPAVDGKRKCDDISPEVAVDTKGNFTLPYTLDEGDEITVKQRSSTIEIGENEAASDPAVVSAPENERWHSDFAVGILLSKEQQELSQANMFMALNTDYALVLPGYYKQFRPVCPPKVKKGQEAPCHVEPRPCCNGGTSDCCQAKSYRPGLDFFFQSRLTAVPVTSQTTPTTSTSVTPGDYDSFLASRKSAHFEFGVYAPLYFDFVNKPSSLRHQAFFIAPVLRFGFNSLVDSVSTTTASTTNGNATTNITKPVGISDPNSTVYNFGLVGLRVGTSDIKRGSPHIRHYVDFGIGKYSNIRDLYCPAGGPTTISGTPYSDCQRPIVPAPTTGAATFYDTTLFHHYTPLRFLTEGFLDLDGFTLGFSINTGLDVHPNSSKRSGVLVPEDYQKAKDDLRFLFGYTVDAKKLLLALTSISKSGSDK